MSQTIMDDSDQQQIYQNSQLVWAKILGWPWWPARIMQIPSQIDGNYKVQFLADTSHAFLPYQKLMPYAQGKDKHSTPKGHYRNFAKALALADKLLQSASTPKDEARTHYASKERLHAQQIQIINQSQQASTIPKLQIEQKIQSCLSSNQNEIAIKQIKLGKEPPIRREINTLIVKKKQIQEKQLELKQMLKKYKLDQVVKHQQRQEQLKLIKKRKLICKGNYRNEFDQENETKVARMIYKALSTKQISLQEKQTVATELMKSFFTQREKEINGTHRALFQWIRCNDAETILENYKSWPIEAKLEHCTDCF